MPFHSPESRARVAERLSFKPKDHQRCQVAFLTRKGYSSRAIADIIGISVWTLRKYFRAELCTPCDPTPQVDVLNWLTAAPVRDAVSTPFWPKDRLGMLKLPGERRYYINRSFCIQESSK
jgi:hypothetical protein